MPGADSGTFDYFTEVDQRRGRRLDQVRDQQSEDDNVLVQAWPATRTPSATSATPTTSRTQTSSRRSQIDGGTGCIAPTADDHRRRDLQAAEPAAVHLPEHGQGQGIAGALTRSSTTTSPTPSRWRPSRPSGTWRLPTTRLEAQQLAHWNSGRRQVGPTSSSDAPARSRAAGASPFIEPALGSAPPSASRTDLG